jgi:hypothetical protein
MNYLIGQLVEVVSLKVVVAKIYLQKKKGLKNLK